MVLILFLFQHFTIRGTFLDAWTGLRSLFLPVQKQLIVVGVNWSGRNLLPVVKNKTKLNQNKQKIRGKKKKKHQNENKTQIKNSSLKYSYSVLLELLLWKFQGPNSYASAGRNN